MNWHADDALHAHALGIHLDGELPQPQAPKPEPPREKPLRLALGPDEDGMIIGWVPVFEWHLQIGKRQAAETKAVALGIRLEGARKALWCAAAVAAIGWMPHLWRGGMWLFERFGG